MAGAPRLAHTWRGRRERGEGDSPGAVERRGGAGGPGAWPPVCRSVPSSLRAQSALYFSPSAALLSPEPFRAAAPVSPGRSARSMAPPKALAFGFLLAAITATLAAAKEGEEHLERRGGVALGRRWGGTAGFRSLAPRPDGAGRACARMGQP